MKSIARKLGNVAKEVASPGSTQDPWGWDPPFQINQGETAFKIIDQSHKVPAFLCLSDVGFRKANLPSIGGGQQIAWAGFVDNLEWIEDPQVISPLIFERKPHKPKTYPGTWHPLCLKPKSKMADIRWFPTYLYIQKDDLPKIKAFFDTNIKRAEVEVQAARKRQAEQQWEEGKQARAKAQAAADARFLQQSRVHKAAHKDTKNCPKCGATGGCEGNVWMCRNLSCLAPFCARCYEREKGFIPPNICCQHCKVATTEGLVGGTMCSGC